MSIFATSDITRYTAAGEEDFASRFKCISVREVIPIVSGTSTYTLNDALLSIIKITYRGMQIDPMPHRDLRDSQLSGTQTGTPYNYIFVPGENIPDTSTNLYKSPDIETFCIVEYWRLPDGSTYTIPAYIRRRLLKAFVMKSLYAMEGKGQNLKAAKYFTNMYTKLSADYGQLLSDLHNKPRNLNHGNGVRKSYKKAPPMLPLGRFGVGVDW